EAIARAAHSLNMQFGGHVSDLVGLEGALAAQQTTVDHLDNYVGAIEREDSPIRNAPPAERAAQLPLHADESKIPADARATREAGVAVVPTMALWEVILGAHDPAVLRTRPKNRYMPTQMVAGWVERVSQIRGAADPAVAAREI